VDELIFATKAGLTEVDSHRSDTGSLEADGIWQQIDIIFPLAGSLTILL
jgi:hypothetical protein